MEPSSALIPINIVIADRNYRIKVAAKDEEMVRKTIKKINDKILEFKTQFAGKDIQDYVAMVLVWYATQNNQGNLVSPELPSGDLLSAIEKIDRMVLDALTPEN